MGRGSQEQMLPFSKWCVASATSTASLPGDRRRSAPSAGGGMVVLWLPPPGALIVA